MSGFAFTFEAMIAGRVLQGVGSLAGLSGGANQTEAFLGLAAGNAARGRQGIAQGNVAGTAPPRASRRCRRLAGERYR